MLQVTELKVSDAYLTVDSSKTNEESVNVNISGIEEQNLWCIKKLWKSMSKIFTKTLMQYGDQYMKLLMSHFSKKQTFFHNILDLCKNIQINFIFYPLMSKQS